MQEIHYHAAGGVVFHDGKVLLLDRPSRDEVRLPKGHIEKDESPQASALREVREETGYASPYIVADLGTQRVQFVDNLRQLQITRDERYFLMRLRDDQKIKRDTHELQFIPIWVPADEAVARLTFEAEQEFMRRALRQREA